MKGSARKPKQRITQHKPLRSSATALPAVLGLRHIGPGGPTSAMLKRYMKRSA